MNEVNENIWIAVAAFLIAIVIKGYVLFIDPVTTIDLVNMPIQPKNIPQGLSVSRIIPDKFEIELKGAKSKVDKFRERDINAIADLSGITSEGEYDIPIRLSQSRFHGITFMIIPETVRVVMGQFEKKFFAPERVVVGEFFGNKMISKIEGLPESVEVSGSITSLSNVKKVIYDLDVSMPGDMLTQQVTYKVIDTNDTEIKNLKVEPANSEIRVYLMDHAIKQRFPVVLKITGTPASEYAVISQEATPLYVEVTGDPTSLKALESVETEPVNIANAKSSIVKTVALVAPAPGTVLSPSEVQVRINISQVTSRREINDIAIEIRRQRAEFKYTLDSPSIDITVQGPVDKLKDLDITLIRQSIDVSKYTEGKYSISLEPPGLPSGVGLVSFKPRTVQLTVESVSG
jgi:YbbR domain-containing protein